MQFGLSEKRVSKKVISAGLTALLIVTALSGCDDNAQQVNNQYNQGAQNSNQHENDQQVMLLDGHFSFTLPAGLIVRNHQPGVDDNIYVYATADGQNTVIVIVSDTSADTLEIMASRLQASQRQRDAQLQVINNQQVMIAGQPLWRFDSIVTENAGRNYSSIVLGKIAQKLVTMQMLMPVTDSGDNQADKLEQQADKLVHSIVVK